MQSHGAAGSGEAVAHHTWVGTELGYKRVGGLLPQLLLSSAVITRFHGLPMGGTGYSAFRICFVYFLWLPCCASASSFWHFHSHPQFGAHSFRFRGWGGASFKYYVIGDKRHLFMSFLEVELCQMERSISLRTSLLVSSLRFVDVNININSSEID